MYNQNSVSKNRRALVAHISDELLDIYGNLELGAYIGKTTKVFHMDTEHRILFTHIIGDTILGIIPENKFDSILTESFTKIPHEKITEIHTSLSHFFKEAEDIRNNKSKSQSDAISSTSTTLEHSSPEKTVQIPKANNTLKEKLELRPETFVSKPFAEIPDETPMVSGVKPLTREEILKAVSPQRTMAGDIASLQNQSDILKVAGKSSSVPE